MIIPSFSSLHTEPGSNNEIIISFFCEINFSFIESGTDSIEYSYFEISSLDILLITFRKLVFFSFNRFNLTPV